jgi:hypothetical protein
LAYSVAQQVTKVELAEFLKQEGAYEIFNATEVTEVMQRFDKNGNGFLGLDEMQDLRAVLQKSAFPKCPIHSCRLHRGLFCTCLT